MISVTLLIASLLTADVIFLDDLTPTIVQVGHGILGVHGAYGYGDTPMITVNGVDLKHALSLHTPTNGTSSVEYELKGRPARLRGKVAFGDAARNVKTPVTFIIKGNSHILWRSPPIAKRTETADFDVDVTGITTLQLTINCPGPNNWCFGVYQDPRLDFRVWKPDSSLEETVTLEYLSAWREAYRKSLKVGHGGHLQYRRDQHLRIVNALGVKYGIDIGELGRLVLTRAKREAYELRREQHQDDMELLSIILQIQQGGSIGSSTFVGPRGGIFHYSANGNKVYQKR